MPTLSPNEIAWLAKSAGFSVTKKVSGASEVVIATAIALGESGGDTEAHNYNPATGDDSWGLWQINLLGSLRAARMRQFNLSKPSDLTNPHTNARAAYTLYRARGNFRDWSVYNNGTYTRHLTKATIGAMQPTAPDGVAIDPGPGGIETRFNWQYLLRSLSGTGNPFAVFFGGLSADFLDVTDNVDSAEILNKLIRAGVLRVATFLGGLTLILLALVLVARQTAFRAILKYVPKAGKRA